MLDLAGLGLIAPFIGLVMNPEALLEGRLGELLFSLGGPTDRETLLLGLSGLLVVLFLGKAIVSLGINNVIIGFAHKQQIYLRTRLMDAYQHLPYPVYLQRNSAEYSLGAKLDRSVSRCLATAVAHTQQRARRPGHSWLAALGERYSAGIAGSARRQHTLRL